MLGTPELADDFGARVRRRHMLRETARAPLQVPQHFDGERANGFLFAPLVDLISFTLYGAEYQLTRERKNLSQIAREIGVSSIFACQWLVPRDSPR